MINWQSVDWKKTNADLARELGCSRERVRQKRLEFDFPKIARTKSMQVKLLACGLGKLSYADVAAKAGVTKLTVIKYAKALGLYVSRRKWEAEDDLGNVPDTLLAEKHNVSIIAVARARLVRGIPIYQARKNNYRIAWKHWDHLLGTKSDSALATEIGCSHVAVLRRRQRLGILPYKRDKACES
jgi:biotin operon repressor